MIKYATLIFIFIALMFHPGLLWVVAPLVATASAIYILHKMRRFFRFWRIFWPFWW